MSLISFVILESVVTAHESSPFLFDTQVAEAGKPMTSKEIQKGLEDAQLLAELGKADAAIYALQQLEKANPNNYTVLVKLGEIALQAKNWAYAIQVLRKASLLQPKDIKVRLTLMDIYKTYNMSVQEFVVTNEILGLAPEHPKALRHLADFYKKQGIASDEIKVRLKLKHLSPDDYPNLKRLAEVFDNKGDLWEAARVYEHIRIYYPDRLDDMRRLAAIYDELDEHYRQSQILDHIAEHGGDRSWMQKKLTKRLRLQNDIFDSFEASSTFQKQDMEELEIDSIISEAAYMHLPLHSSIDFGVKVKHSKLKHAGKGTLDGTMNINSYTLSVQGVKSWHDRDYQLGASVGVLQDDISGSLFLRNPLSGLGPADFPFLRDPTFDSYGGMMVVGGIQFLAQPGTHSSYEVAYEHGLVEELDARLRLFYFDKILFGYTYFTDNDIILHGQIDESAISDGNARFHGSASIDYTLWGKDAVYDYRGKRKGYLRYPPYPSIRAGYLVEYYSDQDDSNVYWSYDSEIQHQGRISGQTRIYEKDFKHNVILDLHLAYTTGDSLDFRQNAGVRIFYLNTKTNNEIGVSYSFEKERIDAISRNLRIIGDSEISMLTVYGKWHF